MTKILQQKWKTKGGTRVFLFIEYSVQKSGGGGAIAPSVPPPSVVGPVMSDELKDVSCDYVFWIFFRESMAVLSFMFAGYMRQILGWGTFLA